MRDLGFTNRHKTSQNHTGFPGKWKRKDVFFTSVVLVGVSCVCFPHQKKEFVQDTTFFAKSELGFLKITNGWTVAGWLIPAYTWHDSSTQVQNISEYTGFLDVWVQTLLDLVGWNVVVRLQHVVDKGRLTGRPGLFISLRGPEVRKKKPPNQTNHRQGAVTKHVLEGPSITSSSQQLLTEKICFHHVCRFKKTKKKWYAFLCYVFDLFLICFLFYMEFCLSPLSIR